jgi:glycerol-3-phosphate dehydrogenase (NAD(P)+)
MDQMRIAVVGAGSWGTTVASMLCERSETLLWAREPEVASSINLDHENPMFLPGLALSPSLRATVDPIEAVADRDLILVAVPVQHLRSTAEQFVQGLSPNATLLSLAKGIERSTLLRPSQVLVEMLPSLQRNRIGVLSGPNLAKEVFARQPTASVVAIEGTDEAQLLQSALINEFFRVYTSSDVVGCEIGGAVKNVIAIAAGAASGLGYGWNSLSGLITRGLAELTRLGVALGGSPLTFLGLAGNGDLIATCSSEQSRNRRVGVELGKGRSLASILADTDMVAEGVTSAPAVLELARGVGVEMPVAEHVGAMLRGELSPLEVVRGLMGRTPTSELHDLEVTPGDRPGRVRQTAPGATTPQIPDAN